MICFISLANIAAQASVGKFDSATLDAKPEIEYQNRWNQVFKLGEEPSKKNLQTVVRALKSPDWYLRDSALRTLPRFSLTEARSWSRKLLDDPSLIVRTTAVQILAQVQTEQDRSLFWKKLTAKENFHAGQSLWIRRHLVRALAAKAEPTEKLKFEALLKDPDSRLYPAAHQALDRIAIRDLCVSRVGQSAAPGECDRE
jgi:HEAT repeat protein